MSPGVDAATDTIHNPLAGDDDTARAAAYAAALDELAEQHRALADRIDPVLDPSTRRVVDVVDADRRALAERLTAIGH